MAKRRNRGRARQLSASGPRRQRAKSTSRGCARTRGRELVDEVRSHPRQVELESAELGVQPHSNACKKEGHDWVLVNGPDMCARCKRTRPAARKPDADEVQLQPKGRLARGVHSHRGIVDELERDWELDETNDEE